MMGRILKVFTWAWFGASIGYIAVGIVALYINVHRYERDPSIDVEDVSDRFARASGLPTGLILGAAYGLKERKYNSNPTT
jgi:hypothetical protein